MSESVEVKKNTGVKLKFRCYKMRVNSQGYNSQGGYFGVDEAVYRFEYAYRIDGVHKWDAFDYRAATRKDAVQGFALVCRRVWKEIQDPSSIGEIV